MTEVNLENTDGIEKIFFLNKIKRILEKQEKGCSVVMKENQDFFLLCKDGKIRLLTVRFHSGPSGHNSMSMITREKNAQEFEKGISSLIGRCPSVQSKPEGVHYYRWSGISLFQC